MGLPEDPAARANLARKLISEIKLVLRKAIEAGSELQKAGSNLGEKQDRMQDLLQSITEATKFADRLKESTDAAVTGVRHMMRDTEASVGVPVPLWPLVGPPPPGSE